MKKKEALVHSQHLINILNRQTELNNLCCSYKNKKTLSDKNILLVKKAIVDINEDKEEQLQVSLKTLLMNNGIKPTTLNNEQISVVFLNGLKDLYGKYVSLETKKVNNKYSKKKECGCCSIF